MRELAEASAPSALLEFMESQHLTALAGTRLDTMGLLPESLEKPVAERLHANRMRALFYRGAAAKVLSALERAGIRALPVKGFALAESVHADPGCRLYGDLDILVDVKSLRAAVDALRPIGYRALPEPLSAEGVPELHMRAHDPTGRFPLVELHWRVHWFERAFSAGMLQRAANAGGVLRAEPADELAALLLFFARDGFLGLRLTADIAAWWDACGPELPPRALDHLAVKHPGLAPVWSTALRVAERVVGLPAESIMSLDIERPRQRLAGRLANWAAIGARDQRSADVSLVNLLLSPRPHLRAIVRRYVFPNRAALDQFYTLEVDDHLLRAAWRIAHPPKMLVRYGLGLMRSRDESTSDPLVLRV
jgi:hypothetical protein